MDCWPEPTGGSEGLISAEEVRRRFAWARRQGRPAWLWPETPIPAWREALGRIATATANVLADAGGAALDGDPEAIGLAAYTSGMGPLLGLWAEQGRLQAGVAVAAVLSRHLAHNRIRSARLAEVTMELIGRLADEGVGVVVLKGLHTGQTYFPEPGVRPASDIDILVRAADAPAAEAALSRGGLALDRRGPWESSWRPVASSSEPRSLTHTHADDPWSVDLHRSLNLTAGPAAAVAELDGADPTGSRTRWLADPRAGVLDQPLLLLHLAAHAGAAWQNLTLLRQVELVLVIRRDLPDWDGLLDLGGRIGALGYAYPALRLCEALAPGTVPDKVIGRCAASAPPAVRQAVGRLTPASAQRVDRASVTEHFMWARGLDGKFRQLAADLLAGTRSWPQWFGIYEERAWRLIRGRVSQ